MYNYSYIATRVFDGFQQTDFDLAHIYRGEATVVTAYTGIYIASIAQVVVGKASSSCSDL